MEYTNEEKEALASAKYSALRKKINAESWNDNMELLMKKWGEKAAGLRFMHSHSGGSWKKFANQLSISSIIITSIASTASFVAANIEDTESQDALLYAIGGIGLVSTLIQSFKKFYNAEEKAADHNAIAKQFGSYYRNMTLQMGMSKEDRDPADILTSWALKEYERLQLEAPSISEKSIVTFKNTFKNSEQSFPDVAESNFTIKLFEEKQKQKKEKKQEKEGKEGKEGKEEINNNIQIDITK